MKRQFFEGNRKRLRHLTVLTAYGSMQRTNDNSFEFEQEANFFWLTGISAPNWRVIVDSDRSWLVAPDVDTSHQIFDGSLSWEDAKNISGITDVITDKDAEELLRTLALKHESVYTIGADPFSSHYDFYENPAGATLRRTLKKYFTHVKDCRLEIARLRAIKQPDEIDALKKAINLTQKTFDEVENLLSNLKTEYEIEAEFTYRFRRSNAKHAYDPIVAGAGNACTLHYVSNRDRLQQGSLVLIDIGARVDGYAADVTRTYAIGKPTKRQVAVHTAVRNAQQEIISLLRTGLPVSVYQKEVDRIMKSALMELDLLKSADDVETYRRYFPHSISHGLGLDVHDSLGRPTELEPGMVITVEPGIYIPEEAIGVRIEDDILITESGYENLSGGLATSL